MLGDGKSIVCIERDKHSENNPTHLLWDRSYLKDGGTVLKEYLTKESEIFWRVGGIVQEPP